LADNWLERVPSRCDSKTEKEARLNARLYIKKKQSASSEMNLRDEHDAHGDASNDVVPQVLADVIRRQPAEAGEEDDEEALHVPAPRVAPPVGTAVAPGDAVQGEFFVPAKGGGTASSNQGGDVGSHFSSLPTWSTRCGLNWCSGLSPKVYLTEALKRLVASKRCVSEMNMTVKMAIRTCALSKKNMKGRYRIGNLMGLRKVDKKCAFSI
jgi:hypothetical protein